MTADALEAPRKRKDEEARQQAETMRANAAVREQAQREYQAALRAAPQEIRTPFSGRQEASKSVE
ncbi:MAG: hypothetical protein ABIJ39_01740 [Chloroflexota bacterium]